MENDKLISCAAAVEKLKVMQSAVRNVCGGCESDTIRRAIDCIVAMEPVEIAKVVYCRNCDSYGASPFNHPDIGWCKITGCHQRPDFFCGHGKERNDGKAEPTHTLPLLQSD